MFSAFVVERVFNAYYKGIQDYMELYGAELYRKLNICLNNGNLLCKFFKFRHLKNTDNGLIHLVKIDPWEIPESHLPGCISEGNTRKEALANIREAIELYLEPA